MAECFWTDKVMVTEDCGDGGGPDPGVVTHVVSPFNSSQEVGYTIYIYATEEGGAPELTPGAITMEHTTGDFIASLSSEDGSYWTLDAVDGTFPEYTGNGETEEMFNIFQGGDTWLGNLVWSLS